VVSFQPTNDDRTVMGTNAMDPGRRAAVAAQVHTTTRQRLRRPALRHALAALSSP